MARRPSPRTLDAMIETDQSTERAAPLAFFASANADADHGACVENAHMDEESLRSLGLVDAERLLDEIHLWECLSARDAEGYDDVHLFVDKSGVRLASCMTSENGGGGGGGVLLL